MLKKLTKQQFQSLPVNEQRIALAKDVLAHLTAKKFVETRGRYFGFANYYDYANAATDPAQEVIRNSPECYVCAKGALVCAFVENFNERTVSGLDEEDPEIVQIFGIPMWRELEMRFEGWGGRYRTPLFDLMTNIITNNGELVINDGYEQGVNYNEDGEATTDCNGHYLSTNDD